MVENNSTNLEVHNNPDGFDIAGGVSKRKIAVSGGDVEMVGSGSNTHNFPASPDTLVGRDSTDTFTNKTINSANNSILITASVISDFDAAVASAAAVVTNSAKTGITSQQATDISNNNAKATYTKTNLSGKVIHGSDANIARPSGFVNIMWLGSVEPINAIDNDEWTDTTA